MMREHFGFVSAAALLLVAPIWLAGCNGNSNRSSADSANAGSNGPANQGPPLPQASGDAAAGQNVFRYETFGDEGFWTDALRLPAGMKAQKVTPLQAMKLGLCVDVDKLDAATRSMLQKQLQQDPTGQSSALLNDPMETAKLVDADAVIGFPGKDSNHDGKIDIAHGDKAGVTCALCHTITDGSLFKMPHGGSIGHREDGRSNFDLNIGKIVATAANSRAFFPMLQLTLKANHGKTFGRAPQGLTVHSTEAEVDAYLSNPKYYPVGMFDDTYDGNGDQMIIMPLFRQDLAAPYLSAGSIAKAENFSNLVYTSLFDPTNITSAGGRKFLHKIGGAAGDEIVQEYVEVLRETHVKGYPYVKAAPDPNAGPEEAPLGVRVDNKELLNLNAYMFSLQAPAGAKVDSQTRDRGRQLFRTSGCTSCHNVDQSKPVPTFIVPMKKIFPGDNPVVLAQRQPPLTPIEHTPGSTFDLKMAVFNASLRGGIRGAAMPLLLDLARQPFFLQDASVPSLDNLLDPSRGTMAPHPFFINDPAQRRDVVAFLKSLDTSNSGK